MPWTNDSDIVVMVDGSFDLPFLITDESDNPQDLTGWSALFEVRTSPGASGAAAISYTEADTGNIALTEAGVGTVSGLAVVAAGVYTWNLRLTDTDGDPIHLPVDLAGNPYPGRFVAPVSTARDA